MEKEKISSSQLFILIIFFELGTAIVLPIGLATQKDVWLSIILASFGGCLLYILYDYLSSQYPDLPLNGYAQKILGKLIGKSISLFYAIFFIYVASRDLRETSELLSVSAYQNTPLLILELFFIVAVVYGVYKGIEAVARTAELFIMIYTVMTVVGIFAIVFGGYIKVENLLPVLEEGWSPVLKNAYPNIMMFPFGEMVCFTTIFPNLKNPQHRKKIGISSLLVCTVILSFVHALSISVLGESLYQRAAFPLMDLIRKVQIGEFLERMDIFAIMTLIMCVFFKVSLYFFAIITIITDVFKIQNKQSVIIPVGLIIVFISFIEASNLSEHHKEGELSLKILLPLFCVVIPVLLLIVHLIRKKISGQSSTHFVNYKE